MAHLDSIKDNLPVTMISLRLSGYFLGDSLFCSNMSFLILDLYPFIKFRWSSNHSSFTRTVRSRTIVDDLGGQVFDFLLETDLTLRLGFLCVFCWLKFGEYRAEKLILSNN